MNKNAIESALLKDVLVRVSRDSERNVHSQNHLDYNSSDYSSMMTKCP